MNKSIYNERVGIKDIYLFPNQFVPYQILSTKLYNPPIKPGRVRRTGLVQRLENGYLAGKCVTLVSAPAGFGKTTIVCEWIAATGPRKSYGWVSLDDGDNDPARFLIYLVSAIQKVNAEIGRTVLTLLQSSQITSLSDLVEVLINEITTAPKSILIVLDDYHVIKNIEVHSLVRLILKRQPDLLHLVIITREDPPLPLARMRVQGQITEIRERDLRFSNSEAQAFLVEVMGIELSLDEVSKLEEHTEGWVAGMQLAALAIDEYPNKDERNAFIDDFTGSNRFIADYLISEVLQRQPAATQQFLLSTSLLQRFCAELCDYVVFGEANPGSSQVILNSLELGNMFLVPLDNQRIWYRYHHLFSEMLFHTLRRSLPAQIPLLHRKASLWFESRGLIPEAVNHALASKDWDYAKSLLDRNAMLMLFQGQGNLVTGWCHEFPKAYLEKAPEICIYYAWALVLTFRDDFLDAVYEKLQIAERAIEKIYFSQNVHMVESKTLVPLKDWIIGQVCVVRSQILLGHFFSYIDPQELIALSLKGLDLLPEEERAIRSTCRINLAHAHLMQNHPIEAQKAFEDTLPFMLEADNFLGAVTNIFYQARLAFYTGQLGRAEMLCRQWKATFEEMAGSSMLGAQIKPEIPATRGLDIVLSLLLLERNQLDEAERLLVKTLELLGWASWMELHGFIILARLRHMRGNHAGVQETLQRMTRLGPQHAACAEALQILFDLKRSIDDPQIRFKAEIWTKKYSPLPGEGFALGIGPYHCDTEYFCNLAWARVQICLGHPEIAAVFVGPALKSAKEHGLFFRISELSITQALIFDGLGNPAAAMTELENALEIAETFGYTRIFDDGPDLDRLLNRAIERKGHSQYIRQLMATFIRLPARNKMVVIASQKANGQPSLVDPLSEREIEVLRHLAMGLAPAEVAKRLYLSPNTLKAHTQNIYSKLDVHSRIEAIIKARELGLV